MHIKELYTRVIPSEEAAFSFLKEHDLLDEEHDADPCHKCGAIMQEKRKRNRKGEFRPVLRCPRRGCQTTRSIRKANRFFHYTDLNGRTNSCMSLCEILELVYFFVMDIPSDTTLTLTGKSPNTVTDWYNMCRKVCGVIVVILCWLFQWAGTGSGEW